MSKAIRIFFLLCSFILVSISYGWAQDVEVYVDPKQAYIGAEIRIYGFVKPNPGTTYARLEFLKKNQRIVERVKADANGEYKYVFKETNEAGTWKVKAWKDGTRKYAEETFVISSRIFMIELVKSLKDLEIDKTKEGLNSLGNLLENYPVFPGKDEMEDDINSLLQEIAQMESLFQKFDNAVKEMEDAIAADLENIPLQAREALRKAGEISTDLTEKVRAEQGEIESLLEESKKESDWCYTWLMYHDFCSKLNNAGNFIISSLKDLAQNLVGAKLTGGLPFEIQQAIQAVVHVITTRSPSVVGFTNYMIGTISGLGTSIYGELLKTCTQYKGEAEGEYHAELRHKGVPFFIMDYKLKGEILLVFQKRKPGDPAVYLKGRFKGKVQDIKCAITMIPFQLPSATNLAWCRSAVPLIAKKSFLLYLEGRATDDRIEIKLKKTQYDFELRAKGYYVILSEHKLVPIPGTFTFPLMDAEWFFTRVTKLSLAGKKFFVLPIRVKGKKSVAENKFEREIYLPETSGRKETAVDLKLKIIICSPDCK